MRISAPPEGSLHSPLFFESEAITLFKKRSPVGPEWLRWLLCAAASLCMGLGVTLAIQYIDLRSLQAVWDWCRAYTGTLLMTVLLYGLPVYVLGALTGRLWVGAIPSAAVGLILALVDHFKSAIDGAPLNLADFSMTAQVGSIMDVAGDLTPPAFFWKVTAVALLCVAALALTRPLTVLQGRSRFLSFGVSLALAVGLCTPSGAHAVGEMLGIDFYKRMDADVSHRLYGLTLSLWRDYFLQDMTLLATFKTGDGRDYDADYMQDVLARIDELLVEEDGEALASLETGEPNILFILSESFFDVTRLPVLSYSRDPVENFHALEAESISGTFHSHYLGHGTGYIDISLLSGLNPLDLPPSFNICFLDEELYERFDALPEQYTKSGSYKAEMVHGHNNSLYNRTVTFPLLGFEDLLFRDDIINLGIQWDSGLEDSAYMQDSYFLHVMLEQMEEINAKGKRAFLYGMTMENHQPYTAEKFGNQCQISLTAEGFTTEEQDIIRSMLEGLVRADEALGELTDALRESDEPAIVVFYGDHRPNLVMPDGDTLYTKLGLCPEKEPVTWTPEQVNDLYSTDYLIWANDAALLQGRAGTKRESSVTSLGAQLLELTGQPISRYWGLLQKVSDVCLTNISSYFVDGQGAVSSMRETADLSPEAKELLSLRDAVIYDALYGKQYITYAMNQAAGTALPPA